VRENTVLLNGRSKSYAMTGWRVGYACGPSEIVGDLLKDKNVVNGILNSQG
jgi:aminotransferase